jgi:hypothetical protein
VLLTARNQFGSVQVDLGELTLYELPPFLVDARDLPAVPVPDLTAFRPPRLDGAIAGRPADPIGTSPVPLPALASLDLIADLRAAAPLAAASPLGRVTSRAAASVSTVIEESQDDFRASLRTLFQQEQARLQQLSTP